MLLGNFTLVYNIVIQVQNLSLDIYYHWISIHIYDPHVPELPPMRNYPLFMGLKSVAAEAIQDGGFDLVLVATDHDAVDYAALVNLGLPIVDTRNAIARRGLPMEFVTKA